MVKIADKIIKKYKKENNLIEELEINKLVERYVEVQETAVEKLKAFL